MRLVMGISVDGYVSRGPKDDMSWLGSDDKIVFKLLTIAGSGVCGASRRTLDNMPTHLLGRTLIPITRSNFCLAAFFQTYKEASLIGGQTIALAALEEGLLDTVHLCRSRTINCYTGQKDELTAILKNSNEFYCDAQMLCGSTVVETYRKC